MNVAFAWHESIADYFVGCLFWLEKGGNANLTVLAEAGAIHNLRTITMERAYPGPPPPPAKSPPPAAPKVVNPVKKQSLAPPPVHPVKKPSGSSPPGAKKPSSSPPPVVNPIKKLSMVSPPAAKKVASVAPPAKPIKKTRK